MRTVMHHFRKYGPNGVPNGRVDTQNLGNGITPCLLSASLSLCGSRKHSLRSLAYLAHSRIIRD